MSHITKSIKQPYNLHSEEDLKSEIMRAIRNQLDYANINGLRTENITDISVGLCTPGRAIVTVKGRAPSENFSRSMKFFNSIHHEITFGYLKPTSIMLTKLRANPDAKYIIMVNGLNIVDFQSNTNRPTPGAVTLNLRVGNLLAKTVKIDGDSVKIEIAGSSLAYDDNLPTLELNLVSTDKTYTAIPQSDNGVEISIEEFIS